jgi:hypothetical protein
MPNDKPDKPDDKADRSKLPQPVQDELARRDKFITDTNYGPPGAPPAPDDEMRRQKEEHDKSK